MQAIAHSVCYHRRITFRLDRGPNTQRSFNAIRKDDSEIVDSSGGGYSYFHKQSIGTRPGMRSSVLATDQDRDVSEYRHSSALVLPNSNEQKVFNKGFGQQKLLPRTDFESQPLIPRTVQMQQPTSFQRDQSFLRRDFQDQQSNLFTQKGLSSYNRDLQPITSQQILVRPTTLNVGQNTLNAQRNQQQLQQIPQQPTWSQQQFTGASSSFNSQPFQRPVVKPAVNTGFISAQSPIRRVIAQSDSAPRVDNNGW
ncbi:unnamed protein product [Adineta ricciae]|uniref:Uncharacterized protein n=1 Tax=Adineta ricciae TaxID=249248 RepID=A0A814KZQ0_ADIRI|nr:unnamed protein product [Adineta ricciae]